MVDKSLIMLGILYAVNSIGLLVFVYLWLSGRVLLERRRLEVLTLAEKLYANARRHQIEKAYLKGELEREQHISRAAMAELAAKAEMDRLEALDEAIEDLEDDMNSGV